MLSYFLIIYVQDKIHCLLVRPGNKTIWIVEQDSLAVTETHNFITWGNIVTVLLNSGSQL